tara:strand:+ start:192 stop:725 length:534 start_codon:yes stop_codon:yes gene_type:complete
MDKERIKHFFEQGRQRGFSREFVRDALVQKGYDSEVVNFVYNSHRMEEQQEQFEQQKAQPRSWGMPLAVLVVALFVFGGFWFLTSNDSGITGHAVKDAQAQLDEITKLNDEITQEKQVLESELDKLKQSDLTIEQKNEIIKNQVTQLEEVHKKMNKERDQIRVLLWDLLNSIVTRGE